MHTLTLKTCTWVQLSFCCYWRAVYLGISPDAEASGRSAVSRQRHLMLVFTSMFFALLVGIPSGILLSRPGCKKDLLNMSCKSLMLVIPAAAGRSGL